MSPNLIPLFQDSWNILAVFNQACVNNGILWRRKSGWSALHAEPEDTFWRGKLNFLTQKTFFLGFIYFIKIEDFTFEEIYSAFRGRAQDLVDTAT